MNYKIKIFLGISILLFLSSTTKAQDTLVKWTPDRILSWEDFQGNPDSLSYLGAKLITGVFFSCSGYSEAIFNLEIYAACVPNKSIVNYKSNQLLNHEQTHFDISEYYARLIKKEILLYLDTAETPNCDSLNIMYIKTRAKEMKFHQNYDFETNHSRNEEKQKEWTQKVLMLLEETEEYAEPIEQYEW